MVPARSETIIEGKTDRYTETEGMVEMDQETTENRPWLIARALVNSEGGRVPVRIIIVQPEPITIGVGAHLAVL